MTIFDPCLLMPSEKKRILIKGQINKLHMKHRRACFLFGYNCDSHRCPAEHLACINKNCLT